MRRMRLMRCLKGYTLADIGELLGVSGNYVKTFEREEVEFSEKYKKK
nr:MAG TPA: antitoxin [Caudoviricetes sp.]